MARTGADTAFAVLTPANTLARLAFSQTYDALISGRQNRQSQSGVSRDALLRMVVKPEQVIDSNVLRLEMEADRRVEQRQAHPGDSTESATDPDTETEHDFEDLGRIWEGEYRFDTAILPSDPRAGWKVGKFDPDTLASRPLDILLCTKAFSQRHELKIRHPHARFNFSKTNKGFCIIGCFRSQAASLFVAGDQITRREYHLNKHSINMQLDGLLYHFQWTTYAATGIFLTDRDDYMANYLEGPTTDVVDMPTPIPNFTIQGRWTLGSCCGRGGQGRVFFASDTEGNVAAIKRFERDARNRFVIEEEIATCQRLADFVDLLGEDDGERVLRMVEVIRPPDPEFSQTTPLDHVYIVFQPFVTGTLADVILQIRRKRNVNFVIQTLPWTPCANRNRTSELAKGMPLKTASLFRDALLGIKALHDGNWMHRDIKPTNIGTVGTPARCVLLDIGTATHIRAGETVLPQPGRFGTVGYLAPEFELEPYNQSIDIWAMGVVLFEMTYGCHPWTFSVNPWRDHKDNVTLRPRFQEKYDAAINRMTNDYNSAQQISADGDYLHLGALFVDMVRYRCATNNNDSRLSIAEVLQHPAWGPLLDASGAKKSRFK